MYFAVAGMGAELKHTLPHLKILLADGYLLQQLFHDTKF